MGKPEKALNIYLRSVSVHTCTYMYCILELTVIPYRAYFSRDLNFANDQNFQFVDLFFTNCYSLSVVTPM